jgi:outer membrane protein assembly factor BamB
VVLVWLRGQGDVAFQRRNLQTLGVGLGAAAALLFWWLGFSRVPWRMRLGLLGAVGTAGILLGSLLRIRGVTGDLVPILEPRWARSSPMTEVSSPGDSKTSDLALLPAQGRPDYSQFLGPLRTATLNGPRLDSDWPKDPPRVIWRQAIGAAWSGFAIVGGRAFTQEQRGQDECVTCYDPTNGRLLWIHTDAARYFTTLAGEGPRCTPTVVSNRVYALGATGILNCLDLESGSVVWQRVITTDARAGVPEWGFSGSPLVHQGLVVVNAGGGDGRSQLAYDGDTGELVWSSGNAPISYGSPFLTELGAQTQILTFNARRITAYEPSTGHVLWEHPWPGSFPRVANPVVVGTNRVLFSSGYGVGSELIEIERQADSSWITRSVWKSKRMKAKFANLVMRDGFLYGLDDGILACLDLADGSQRWKEGRYGHGQGLLVNDLFLLMAESGDLVLLRPAPQGPNELHRFTVFSDKSWNPIALAGDLLLVRNDQEAAAVILPLAR